MQLVIDIDEYEYKRVKELVSEGVFDYEGTTAHLFKRVANSTPLPKGHGDLVDRNEFNKDWITNEWITDDDGGGLEEILSNAPTIIEADKE